MKIILEVHNGLSLIPSWPTPGFVKVTKCKNCNAVGYYSDHSIHDPCRNCGGRVKTEDRPAKIIDGVWNFRDSIDKGPKFYKKEAKTYSRKML